jgi:hypothetical protein
MTHAMGARADAYVQKPSSIAIEHRYDFKIVRDGVVIDEWTEWNLVPNVGLAKYLDATLKTGLAAPSWFLSIITGPGAGNTYANADTMASHAGWAENTNYSAPTRPAWTPGAITTGNPSSVDNSGATASFVMTAGATIAGAFMVDNSTKGGSTGTLISEVNFTTGDRVVLTGDTIVVTMTMNASPT